MPRRPPSYLDLLARRNGNEGAREREERARRRADPARIPLDTFYGSGAWRRLRDAHLASEPLCRLCAAQGRTEPAVLVDHVVPITEAWARRLDDANLQSLCRLCHDRKTAADLRRPAGSQPADRAKPSD